MARKKVREAAAKSILASRFAALLNKSLPISVVSVNAETDWVKLCAENAWLASPTTKLVVKPDM